jgi:hypothetical protein
MSKSPAKGSRTWRGREKGADDHPALESSGRDQKRKSLKKPRGLQRAFQLITELPEEIDDARDNRPPEDLKNS